ncbi:hypothetical protein L6452_37539 [Arctium lappa]|uniref:Uncharacterized protein n=1 Tax=Arctium lappa TaxID=4217 RepID=A0ACB8Y7E6_ARCLA|nr:hypothetical protein L6452_37539 [Arctium lappa]
MVSQKLKIILHSAKGLSQLHVLGTMDPYAVVWIAGDGKDTKPCKTAVARNAASSPVWDCPMEFDVFPIHNNHILFCEIKHDGKLIDKKIGEVQVPFTDLLAGDASGEKVSYPVKTSSGEVKGEIILSHKFSERIDDKDCTNTGTGTVADAPRKKVKGKKEHEIIQQMAMTLAKKVATKAVLAGMTVVGAPSFDSTQNASGSSPQPED